MLWVILLIVLIIALFGGGFYAKGPYRGGERDGLWTEWWPKG